MEGCTVVVSTIILLAMEGLAEMVVMRAFRAVSSLTYEEHVRYKL